jgi:hypothetical protein
MLPAKKLGWLVLVTSLPALALMILPSAVFAQGCIQCYQSAAAAGPRTIQALRNGIFMLMIPPFFICVGITVMAFRRRNLQNEN